MRFRELDKRSTGNRGLYCTQYAWVVSQGASNSAANPGRKALPRAVEVAMTLDTEYTSHYVTYAEKRRSVPRSCTPLTRRRSLAICSDRARRYESRTSKVPDSRKVEVNRKVECDRYSKSREKRELG